MATTSSSMPDRRPILVIDTSSSQGGIALYDGQTLSTRSWPAERSHTTTLLSEIHHLLDKADLQVRDLGAVGIALGPGAFTGLRVGFGVAKGFHLATGLPLIAIPTLEAAALAFASCANRIVTVIGAGRGRLVWAHYDVQAGVMSNAAPPRNGTVAELAAELRQDMGPVLVVGELDDEQAQAIEEIERVSIPPGPLRLRQPAALAEFAWREWLAGNVDDAETLEPVYLPR